MRLSFFHSKQHKNGILLIPNESGANPYINRLRETLAKDFDVYSLSDIRKHPWWVLTRLRGVYVNWLENDPKRRNIWILWMLRWLGIRLVWTHHNKQPHDREFTPKAQKFCEFLKRNSDTIVIHCHESLKCLPETCHSRVQFFPIGNYVGVYEQGNADFRKKLGIPADAIVFLYLGQIRKYKGVDVLLEAFRQVDAPQVHLIVEGQLDGGEKLEYDIVTNAVADSRVHLSLRWIPDGEIRDCLDAADVAVMPLNQQSSLNSSSILMAFSCGKTVIAPWIGTLLDYKNQPPFFYAYNYSSREEHVRVLAETMKRALADEAASPGHLRRWGEEALRRVRLENDWDSFRPIFRRIFDKQEPSTPKP